MDLKKIRTRIAPSPTGENLHIGNLYTALINYAVAKKHEGQFIVRVEDTDRQRYVEKAEEKIVYTLKAFGLFYDEGPDKDGPHTPYRQSERLAIYKEHALELISKGRAYYCFCSKERLDELRKKQNDHKQTSRYDKHCLLTVTNAEERIQQGASYVIRLNVEPHKAITFTDIIRGEITFQSDEVDDQVLLKSDGFPTYHLGVVVDDHIMQVSHIIRAEEWISSTPKHILLYEAFGWELPIFAHLPILRNPDKSKLSKRKNPVWALWYLEEGYLPEAILNYLSLMGWSHPEEKEIFSLEEFIRLFELKDVKPVGPIFDLAKLNWMNGEYIRHMSKEALKDRLIAFDPTCNDRFSPSDLDMFITLAQPRMKTLKEFNELISEPTEKNVYTDEDKKNIQLLSEHINTIVTWDIDTVLSSLKELKEKNISMKQIYLYVTGKKQGLPLIDLMVMRGKKETIVRLKNELNEIH